ncbi:uncharacterized protein [Mytilus edulis]|uniref:uncharacterized protein isoform X2 n=1 Tax=Mytilus edulis TaxID=6550 RepID=UPI0039F0F303
MCHYNVGIRRLFITLYSITFVSCGLVQDNDVTNLSDSNGVNLILLGAFCLAFLVVLVLAVFSCGGCEDMSGDVASESHPACGKQSNNYSTVVTDANTSVLMSSHTMGDSANGSIIPPQNLPYSLHPSSTQGFTGYQSSSNTASAPQNEPPPPSYEQANRQSGLAGYGY